MGGKKPTTPVLPTLQAAPPAAAPSISAPVYVPPVKTVGQSYEEAVAAQEKLPAYAQLNNPLDPKLQEQLQNQYYQQYERPGIEQAKANLQTSGQNYGSYGGAYAAQLEAMANLNKFGAGLQLGQQNFNNIIAARDALGVNNTAGQVMSQNQMDVNRGLGVSQLEYDQTKSNNNYGLQSASMANQFNLGNFSNQIQARQVENERIANRNKLIGQLAMGAVQTGVGFIPGGGAARTAAGAVRI